MAYQHLNEQRLAKALEKYTAFLAQEQDAPFVSFADSEKRTKTLGEETYKEKNQKRANQEIADLDFESALEEPGKLTSEMFAIIRRRSGYLVNRYTVDRMEEVASRNLIVSDQAFYTLYRDDSSDEETFKTLVKIFGKNYSFIAFLFFIKGGHYLPVSGNLSKSLRMMGTSFPINNCCSWENYNEFITIVEELQQFIVETEVDPEASLLHAHSFLWTYRYDDVQKGLVEPKYNSPKSAESLAEDAADLALNRSANSSKLKPQSVVIAPQKPAGSMISNGREVCRRSTQRAINAMGRANYQCEINPEHESFVRRSNKKPYVEAHHLIPLAYWRDFEYSIDVEANIVALCSTCHNRIHLGEDSKDLVKTLYEKRKEELEQSGIGIDLDSLLNMY